MDKKSCLPYTENPFSSYFITSIIRHLKATCQKISAKKSVGLYLQITLPLSEA